MSDSKDFFSLNDIDSDSAYKITIGARGAGKLFFFEQLCIKQREEINRQKLVIEELTRHHKLTLADLEEAHLDIKENVAEIERLKKENHHFADIGKMYSEVKAEAVKEFAERSEKEIFIKQADERKQMLKILKTYRGTRAYSDTEQATDNWLRGYGEAVQDILSINNNLVKEMVGED